MICRNSGKKGTDNCFIIIAEAFHYLPLYTQNGYDISSSTPGIAAALYYKDKVDAFLGPGCTDALDPVARMAAYWNLPIITGENL